MNCVINIKTARDSFITSSFGNKFIALTILIIIEFKILLGSISK